MFLGIVLLLMAAVPSCVPVDPTSTTTEPAVTARVPCFGKRYGELLSDPSVDCSTHYYLCMGGQYAIARPCAAGTYFDIDIFACGYMQDIVKCGAPPKVTTAAPTTTTNDPSLASSTLDFVCEHEGVFGVPGEPCSTRYMVCDGELAAHVGQCAHDTYYHRHWRFCLGRKHVPTCRGGDVLVLPSGGGRQPPRKAPTTTTTEAPVTGPTTTPDPQLVFMCADGNNEGHVAPDVQCAPYFYKCTGGYYWRLPCPLRLSYNQDIDQCVKISQNPYCKANACAHQKSYTTYRAPDGECDHYIVCLAKYPTMKRCEPGTLFSAKAGACVAAGLARPNCQ